LLDSLLQEIQKRRIPLSYICLIHFYKRYRRDAYH